MVTPAAYCAARVGTTGWPSARTWRVCRKGSMRWSTVSYAASRDASQDALLAVTRGAGCAVDDSTCNDTSMPLWLAVSVMVCPAATATPAPPSRCRRVVSGWSTSSQPMSSLNHHASALQWPSTAHGIGTLAVAASGGWWQSMRHRVTGGARGCHEGGGGSRGAMSSGRLRGGTWTAYRMNCVMNQRQKTIRSRACT